MTYLKRHIQKTNDLWKKHSQILNTICFTSSIFCSFLYCCFGLDFNDSPFWYNSYRTNEEYSSLIFGTTVFMKWLTHFFNDQVINYRIINVIIQYCAVIIPLIFVVAKNIRIRYWGAILLLSSWYFTSINYNILSPDSFTIFFISLTYTLSFNYFKTKNLALLISTTFVVAIASTFRLPNILLIAPILFEISIQSVKNTKKIYEIIYTLLSTLCIYFSLIFIFDISFTSHQKLDDSHNIYRTTYSTFRSFLPILSLSIFISVFNILHTIKKQQFPFIYNLLFYSIVAYNVWNSSGYNQTNAYLLISLFVLPNIITFQNQDGFFKFLILLFYALIAAAGSNTGYVKISHGFIFTIPIIFAAILQSKFKELRLLLMSITIFIIFFNKIMLTETFEDKTIVEILNDPKKTSLETYQKTDCLITANKHDPAIFSALATLNVTKGQTLYYGNKGLMIKYLSPNKVMRLSHFWEPQINDDLMSEITKFISKNKCSFIMIPKEDENFLVNFTLLKSRFNIQKENRYLVQFNTHRPPILTHKDQVQDSQLKTAVPMKSGTETSLRPFRNNLPNRIGIQPFCVNFAQQ